MFQKFFSITKGKLDKLLITNINLIIVFARSHFQITINLLKDWKIQVSDILINEIDEKFLPVRTVYTPFNSYQTYVTCVNDGTPALENLYQLEFCILHTFQ